MRRKSSSRLIFVTTLLVSLVLGLGASIAFLSNYWSGLTYTSSLDKLSKTLEIYPVKSSVSNFLNLNFFRNTTEPDFILAAESPYFTGIRGFDIHEESSAWHRGKLFLGEDVMKIRLKAKGITPQHWLGNSRSFKVKSKKSKLFPNGNRELNFDLISHPAIVADQLAYQLAQSLGLLMPHHEIKFGQVNKNFPRFFQVVGTIDEQLMRVSSLMPGDIYRLDFEGYKRLDRSFKSDVVSGFDDQLLWVKSAVYNHFPDDEFNSLQVLLDAIHQGKDLEKYDVLTDLIDIDFFARFLIYLQLVQSNHMDNNHNTYIYYDPWKNKYYPIIDDIMAWYSPFGSNESFVTAIPKTLPNIKNFLLNESFKNDFFDAVKKIPAVKARIRKIWPALEKVIATEMIGLKPLYGKYRDNILGIPLIDLGTSIYSPKEIDRAVDQLENYIKASQKAMGTIVNDLTVKDDITISIKNNLLLKGNIVVDQNMDYRDYDVFVEPGTTFLLGPGTSVFFGESNLIGKTELPITFKRLEPELEFDAIIFEGAQKVRLENVVVSGGSGLRLRSRQYTGQLNFQNIEKLEIDGCTVSNSSKRFDDNIHIIYVKNFNLKSCKVYDSPFDGIDIDISRGGISGFEVVNSGNDGVDLMSSTVDLKEMVISNSGDKGLSVGEDSNARIEKSYIYDNKIGVEIKDKSVVKLSESVAFKENELDVNLYKKNWRFGSGGFLHKPRGAPISLKFDKWSKVLESQE